MPNLDRLATEGMRFTDAHTPSSVCTPTRYGLLTGRYCWRSTLKKGVLSGYSPALIEPGRPTLASFLKQQGYRTAGIGKWHLGLGTAKKTDYAQPLTPGPVTAGFDYYFGIPASLDMPPYVYVENEHPLEAPTETVADSKHQRAGGEGFYRGGPIAPGLKHIEVLPKLASKAEEFLRAQTTEQPFFLYVPLTSPHTPWLPDASARGRTKVGDYGDFVAQTDDAIGRILKTLADTGLAENTLVIVTSDNGSDWPPGDIQRWGHRANANWRGQKADGWEGGHRVPFVVRWPGKVKAGSTSDAVICLTDIFATVAEVIGQKAPEAAEDSQSFLPILEGRQEKSRDVIVHHAIDGTFAIRQGSWKLITALGSHGFSEPKNVVPTPDGPKGQLYDLAADPGETNNLWLKEPARVESLTALLKERQARGERQLTP
jgi:arylsulfatase A-like enzyme